MFEALGRLVFHVGHQLVFHDSEIDSEVFQLVLEKSNRIKLVLHTVDLFEQIRLFIIPLILPTVNFLVDLIPHCFCVLMIIFCLIREFLETFLGGNGVNLLMGWQFWNRMHRLFQAVVFACLTVIFEPAIHLLQHIIDLGELPFMVLLELKMILAERISFGLVEHQGLNNSSKISFKFIFHERK